MNGLRSVGYPYVARRAGWVAVSLMGAALCACSPPTETEKAYLEDVQAKAQQQENLRRSLDTVREDESIIQMVKAQAAADGRGTYEEWVSRQINVTKGTVLFPRWQVQRRGGSRFDVTFSFSLMDAASQMSKKGFLWQVDTVLKQVREPRELSAQELMTRGVSRLGRQRQQAKPSLPAIELE